MKAQLAILLVGILALKADVFNGTSSGDTLIGGSGDDLISLGDGDDVGQGEGGNDLIWGGGGSDSLYGGSGNDMLIGGSALVLDDSGGNSFTGGAGNDFLAGGKYGDTYYYNLGDGFDIIRESGSLTGEIDKVVFGAGISSSSITFGREQGDLFVELSSGDILKIESWFGSSGGEHQIEEFQFDSDPDVMGNTLAFDGTTWIGTSSADTYTASGSGNIWALGGDGNDILTGSSGLDVLVGGLGNDTLSGGNGNDGVYGEAGNDTLNGGSGNDVLEGGSGTDTLNGGADNDTLIGGAGDDTLNGDTGSDVYKWNPGDGNDTISDSISETTSINRLLFGPGVSPVDVVLESSGSYGLKLIVMSAGQPAGSVIVTYWKYHPSGTRQGQYWRIEFVDGTVWDGRVLGTPLDDTLTGTSGADTLNGGAGNDVVSGNDGDDFLYGEDGNDTIYGNNGADLLSGGNGSDTLTGGVGNDTLIGGPGDDTLNGDSGTDIYQWNLGDGNDTVTDSSTEATSVKRLLFGSSISPGDIVMTASGSYGLKFTVMSSGAPVGSVILSYWKYQYSGPIQSTLWRIEFANGTIWDGRYLGTPLADSLTGTSGPDTISGGANNDNISGQDGDDLLYGEDGNDSLTGGNGNDSLFGADGGDTLSGNSGNDRLEGGSGVDTLNGGGDNDTLIGGAGDDTLSGDGGSDIYQWNLGDGNDIISENISETTAINRLQFGAGISPADVVLESSGGYGLKLTVMAGGIPNGSVSITYWKYHPSGTRQSQYWRIEFLDGTTWDGNILGTPLDDTLTGTAGADTLNGGTGNDTVSGNDGDDFLYGEDGNDSLSGGNGADLLGGGNGNDTLNAGSGNDTLVGGAGDDILNGESGSDTYQWNVGDGNDTITDSHSETTSMNRLLFGAGVSPEDLLIQGSGTYGVKFSVMSGGLQVGSVVITYWKYHPVGVRQSDYWQIEFADGTVWEGRLLGTELNDTLTGTSGAEIIRGGGGNDSISGSGGNDSLYGDTGDDVLNGGTGDDRLEGGFGSDTLTGNEGADTLVGGPGNDQMDGSAGDDVYEWNIGDGDDLITELTGEASGISRITFGEGILPTDVTLEAVDSEALKFNVSSSGSPAGSVTIVHWLYEFSSVFRIAQTWRIEFKDGTIWDGRHLGTPFGDRLSGTSADDFLSSEGGNDLVSGGNGSDLVHGGSGNDHLDGDGGDDQLFGGAGEDWLRGGVGDDALDGGEDDDILMGQDGNDTLFGGNGDDTLYGEAGDDDLTGGPGNDILQGSLGNDSYFWNAGDGHDEITDDFQGSDPSISRLIFGEGILPSEVTTESVAGAAHDIRFVVHDDEVVVGSVVIKSWNYYGFLQGHNRSWRIEFEDGTVWDGNFLGTVLNDSRHGTSDDDTFQLGEGDDIVSGLDGDDTLEGESGNDNLNGGNGNDLIVGGTGDDTLWGGSGQNTFEYRAGDGNDHIYPNTLPGANKDIIDMSSMSRDQVSIEFQAGSPFDLLIKITSTNEWILVHGGNLVIIKFSDGLVEYNDSQIDVHDGSLAMKSGWQDQDGDRVPDDIELAMQSWNPSEGDPEDGDVHPSVDAIADASLATPSGNRYPTIGEAIAAADSVRNGRPYVIVDVEPGTYEEVLNLAADGVFVRGPGGAGRATVVRGDRSSEHSVKGDSIVMEGLCIGEPQAALRFNASSSYNSSGIRFVNCLFTDQSLTVSRTPLKPIAVDAGDVYFLHCTFIRLSGMEVSGNANVSMVNSLIDMAQGSTWNTTVRLKNHSSLFGKVSGATPNGLMVRSDGLLKVAYPARTAPALDYASGNSILGLRDLDGEPRDGNPDAGCDEYVDEDNLGAGDQIPDAWEIKWFGNVVAQDADGDPDADGEENLAEYDAESNPTAFVPGAGVSVPIDLSSASVYQSVNLLGAMPVSEFGNWLVRNDGKITLSERQGSLEYRFVLGHPTVAALFLDVTFSNVSTLSSIPSSINGTARIYLDDQLVDEISGSLQNVITPLNLLSSGEHVIRVQLVNSQRDYRPVINALSVRSLLENLMTEDLTNVLVQSTNGLVTMPLESAVNPAFIEGTSAHPRWVSLSIPGLQENLSVTPGPGSIWFSNVPLNPTGTTAVQLSFENGLATENHNIAWKATELEKVPALTIRKGDSLKLVAVANGATHGSEITYWLDGVQIGDAVKGVPLVHLFDTSGDFVITAKIAGSPIAGAQTAIKVLEADFGDPAILMKGAVAELSLSGNLQYLHVQGAESLNLYHQGSELSINPEKVGSFVVVARIGEDGPIMATGEVRVFSVAGTASNGGGRILRSLPSGQNLVNMTYTVDGPIPPNLMVKIELWIPGTTFLDGSTVAWLTAADFNEYGIANIEVLTNGGRGGICQRVNFFLSE